MSILNALTSGGGVALTGDTTGNLVIQSAGANTAVFTTGGNLGIGNTAPATTLSVSGNILAGTANAVANGGGFDSYMAINRTGANDSVSYNLKNGTYETNIGLNSSWAFGVYSATASTYRFTIDHSGNVYSQRIYDNTTSGGGNVRVQSNGLLQRDTSSLKYKNSIENATHGLNEVLALRPVTYKGNADGDKVFGGLIAEEVDAAGLTEFVQYAEDGSPDALSYGNMVSLAFKAIQELNAKVDAQAAEIAALKGA